MKNKQVLLKLIIFFLLGGTVMAQKIAFEEYDLSNGLHVILQKDNSAPVVTTSVMYHVGAKDEKPDRTGFAHFFEHLLFEGTQNIGRGEWFKIVSSKGGTNNANTTDDRTYYYETFPSNALEVGLWMESERMLHPIINQVGVDTQNEVVKEEKRLRVDNRPYGSVIKYVKQGLFKNHPYRWTTIGEMEHLDAATLDEFLAFNKTFYVPNNATLVVSGDIDIDKTKQLILKYFADIPRGKDIVRKSYIEEPITQTVKNTVHDANIRIPAVFLAYRVPSMKTREALALNMISIILSRGKSSRMYRRLVEREQKLMEVFSFNIAQEDYGMYVIGGIPMGAFPLQDVISELDVEIEKIKKDLISEREFEKLQNRVENDFVGGNSTSAGIAASLATYHMLYGDTDRINKELNMIRSITREEIREVARKYLNKNQRLELEYLPAD